MDAVFKNPHQCLGVWDTSKLKYNYNALDMECAFLDPINDLRKGRFNTKTGNEIPMLSWDNSLEMEAREVTERCVLGEYPHDEYSPPLVKSTTYIAFPFDVSGAFNPIEHWASGEEAFFNEYHRTPVVDSFVSLVWAGSTRVGCSVSICPSGITEGGHHYENQHFLAACMLSTSATLGEQSGNVFPKQGN